MRIDEPSRTAERRYVEPARSYTSSLVLLGVLDSGAPLGSLGGRPRRSRGLWAGRLDRPSCVTPVFIAGRMAPAYPWAPWWR